MPTMPKGASLIGLAQRSKVPKAVYLTVCIDRQLKAALQGLAKDEGRNLTNFIEFNLHRLVAAHPVSHKGLMPRRQKRGAPLHMWLNAELKAKLQELATDDYRTVTDFVEMSLHRIPVAGLPDSIKPQGNRRKHLNLRRNAPRTRIFLTINPRLKATLQRLADEEYRDLTNFIEFNLHRVVAAHPVSHKGLMPRRQKRGARLTMRVSRDFKANLQNLADQDYRTLTDFLEIKLRRIVVTSHAKLGFDENRNKSTN